MFGGVTTLSYAFAQLSNMKILIMFLDGTKIIYFYLQSFAIQITKNRL